jgi:hypothetical protein
MKESGLSSQKLKRELGGRGAWEKNVKSGDYGGVGGDSGKRSGSEIDVEENVQIIMF